METVQFKTGHFSTQMNSLCTLSCLNYYYSYITFFGGGRGGGVIDTIK